MSRSAGACNSVFHAISRRRVLGGMAAAAAGCIAARPALARAVAGSNKRVLQIFLHGGVSQLESWDPKPGTATGGPFRAIPTTVPGIHISELLPWTARQMHHLALVRGMAGGSDDHARGQREMFSGRDQPVPLDVPDLGAVVAKACLADGFALPGHVLIRGAGGGPGNASYLGPRYAGVIMEDGKPPAHTDRPAGLGPEADRRRTAFRDLLDRRFAARRRTADTDAYTFSHSQALDLLDQRQVFDVDREPERDHERYGRSEFGRHCLLARRLLEHGVPFVQVNHSNYDTHFENFDFHIEQLGEFDRPFATLVADLATRGLLDDTLVCVMSEFGRTPRINAGYGRDHWGKSWSILLGGAGLQRGAVIGRTSADGMEVVERPVDHGHVFHTVLRGIGVDSSGSFHVGGRDVPIADPAKGPIDELLV
ncbi:MAG: DUF1501 domain-containing protein [Planctomycetaceae bacterium]